MSVPGQYHGRAMNAHERRSSFMNTVMKVDGTVTALPWNCLGNSESSK